MKNIVIWVFLISFLYPQNDNESLYEYFPMQIGDTWQYLSTYSGGSNNYTVKEIIGDTLMPNGQMYFEYSSNEYFRVDTSLSAVYKYSLGDCTNDEYEFIPIISYQDTTTIWTNCANIEAEISFSDSVTMRKIVSSISSHHEWSFTKSIGLTRYYLEVSGNQFHLDEFIAGIIGGIQYGDFVSIDNFLNISQNISLEQNYPNPFNSSTIIPFKLNKSGEAILVIYDIKGRMVEYHQIGFQEPGNYKYLWESKKLPSGIYFIQLNMMKTKIMKKAILIK